MNRIDDPTPPTPPVEARIVLPRPNLGPDPWSDSKPDFGPFGLILGSTLAILALTWTIRRSRRNQKRPLKINETNPTQIGVDAELTPSRRLIASSSVVRAALIAEFGPGWGSRTTEEIADDPTLAGRLGPESASAVVAYLRRVDRAKFSGEESDDADEWIAAARAFLDRLPRTGRTARPSG